MEWLDWLVNLLAACGSSALLSTVLPNSHPRSGLVDAGLRLVNLAGANFGQSRNRL